MRAWIIRTSTLCGLAAVVGVSPDAAAQEPRFSIELTGGRTTTTAIYDHAVVHTADFGALLGSREHARLSLTDASTASARLAVRVAGPWRVTAEVGRGSSRYNYFDRFTSDGSSSYEEWFGPARMTALGIGLARRTRLFTNSLFLEPEVGAAVLRLGVSSPLPLCPAGPPSQGLPPSPGVDVPGVSPGPLPACAFRRERWQRTYTVPSVAGSLTLGYRIFQQLSVHLRGQYSVGRTSTAEGFWEDFTPELDYAEAPRSRQIRSVRFAAGVSLNP